MEETILRSGDAGHGVKWKVVFDNDPTNPRREWDNGSIMLCEHGRYDLGDEDARDKAIEAVRGSRDYRPAWEDEGRADSLDLSAPNDLWTAIQRCSDIIARPLYLYDHSGITIRMSKGGNPFHCPWDSGMVGFIFATKAMILKNWVKPEGSALTAKLKAKAVEMMESETSTYDDFLTGQVFGYVVYTEDEDGDEDEVLDSCWGIFGDDYAEQEAEQSAKHYAEEAAKNQAADMAEEMEDARPDMYA